MKKTIVATLLSALAATVMADINVGVTLSATGPAASLGIPEKNTIDLLPKTIGGQKVNYIVLDDASDTTTAVKNARKLISENKVDVLIGSTTTPNSLAMIDVAAETETPMIAMAASARIVEPMDDKKKWVFKTPQNDAQMSTAIVKNMTNNNVKTVAYIGFSDAYGEGWWNEFSKIAEARKIKLVANERFNRTDTSVTGQILKILAAQLPADHPVKKSAMEYVTKYEAAQGKGTVPTFGAHAWDAGLLLATAAPVALKKAQPGSKEFRAALRDALEGTKNLPAAHGVFNMSPTDHLGFDQRARVMVMVENGNWKLLK